MDHYESLQSHDKNDDIKIDSIKNLKILNNDLTFVPQSEKHNSKFDNHQFVWENQTPNIKKTDLHIILLKNITEKSAFQLSVIIPTESWNGRFLCNTIKRFTIFNKKTRIKISEAIYGRSR